MISAQLDTSVLIGTYIAIGLAFIGALITIGCAVFAVEGYKLVSSLVSGVVTALVVGLTLVLVWFPFGYNYNHYVPVSGTVTQVNSRFIGDGSGGTTQYWAIWFGQHPYKCDDTRCGGLHAGSQVTLLCEQEFQFNAPQQGYICNWGKLGLNG